MEKLKLEILQAIMSYLVEETSSTGTTGNMIIYDYDLRDIANKCVSIFQSIVDFDNQPNQFGIDIGKLGYLSPYLDGKEWCVLHGENIQSGVCGFGSTPKEATDNFISEILKSERNRIWEGILKHPDIEQNDIGYFDNDDEIYEVIFKQ